MCNTAGLHSLGGFRELGSSDDASPKRKYFEYFSIVFLKKGSSPDFDQEDLYFDSSNVVMYFAAAEKANCHSKILTVPPCSNHAET